MKKTINGKRYDTSKCENLTEFDHHNNGNYSGTTHLLRAANGDYLYWVNSNGQDCWLTDELDVVTPESENWQQLINNRPVDDDAEKRMIELGLIEIV